MALVSSGRNVISSPDNNLVCPEYSGPCAIKFELYFIRKLKKKNLWIVNIGRNAINVDLSILPFYRWEFDAVFVKMMCFYSKTCCISYLLSSCSTLCPTISYHYHYQCVQCSYGGNGYLMNTTLSFRNKITLTTMKSAFQTRLSCYLYVIVALVWTHKPYYLLPVS